jgi:DNA mismatch repair protein MutS
VRPGPANQSYGLQVAALAGVPRDVIHRARAFLATLESQQRVNSEHPQVQLPLSVDVPKADDEPVCNEIDSIDPDDLTPREALAVLYRLKKLRRR